MTFHCAHRGFMNAVNDPDWGYLGPGIVMSNTQSSYFVRSYNTTSCNGFEFGPGRLRRHDLGFFNRAMPRQVERCVTRQTETRDVIVYRFFHYRGRLRCEHGWVVTARDDSLIRFFVTGPTYKSADVIARIIPEITRG